MIINNITALVRVFALPIIVFITGLFLLEFMRIDEVIDNFDKPVHFVAGTSLSFSLIILIKNLELSGFLRSRPIVTNMITILIVVVIVICLWELYEFSMDTILNTKLQDSPKDTRHDMANSFVGGIVPLLFYKLINIKVNFNK